MARNFSSFIDAYLKFTEGHESTERIRKWCAISILGAALERRVWLDRAYYTLFPNLYIFIIGKSGLIKKSTTTGIAVDLLYELTKPTNGIKIMSDKLNGPSLIEQMKHSGKTFGCNGKRITQSALYAYASELSVFLTETTGGVVDLLTTFYDCKPHDSTIPWKYRLRKEEVSIYGPCLNMLGASTKAWLKKCIPKSEMEGGFTSRIIFVVENSLPPNLVAWPVIGADFLRIGLIADLKAVFQMAGEMKPNAEARAIFTKWYEHHMTEVLPMNSDPRMSGYMSRKGDTILKLAMIRSASMREDYTITREDIVWAVREIDALETDWRMAFDGLGAKANLAFELRDYVRKKVKVTKRELFQLWGQQAPTTEILKCMRELVDLDEVREMSVAEGDKVTEYYVLPGIEGGV